MNSKERMLASMNHEIPDRVPVMCQLSLGHYFLNSEIQPSRIWFDSEIFARNLVERQQEYGFDGILVNIPGRPADWQQNIIKEEFIGNRELLYWKGDLITEFPPDDNPVIRCIDNTKVPRPDFSMFDPEDINSYLVPGYIWGVWHMPYLWGFMDKPDLRKPVHYPACINRTFEIVKSMTEDLSIHVEVYSPFTHFMELFGYEQALISLVVDPVKCQKILAMLTKFVGAQTEVFAKTGPDAILVSSAFAGAGFIDRDMYKNFVQPYENEVFLKISSFELKSYVHTCGAIGDRLDLMAQTEVNGIDTLDPPPLGTVELDRAKEKYGKRFFFKGNLDSVNDILFASDEHFEKAVIKRIRTGMKGSGYILSTACSVAPAVKPGRLKKLVNYAETYGTY